MVNLLENGRYVPFAASRLYPAQAAKIVHLMCRPCRNRTY